MRYEGTALAIKQTNTQKSRIEEEEEEEKEEVENDKDVGQIGRIKINKCEVSQPRRTQLPILTKTLKEIVF